METDIVPVPVELISALVEIGTVCVLRVASRTNVCSKRNILVCYGANRDELIGKKKQRYLLAIVAAQNSITRRRIAQNRSAWNEKRKDDGTTQLTPVASGKVCTRSCVGSSTAKVSSLLSTVNPSRIIGCAP